MVALNELTMDWGGWGGGRKGGVVGNSRIET